MHSRVSLPLRLTTGLSLLFTPAVCSAQASALARNIEVFLTEYLIVAAGGVVALFIFYYGARLILESQNEGVLTETRKSFLYAITGFAILAVMYPLAYTFTRGVTSQNPINTQLLIPHFDDLRGYIIIVAEGVFVLLLTFHALRLLASMGDESAVEKSRKGIIQNIAGIVLMALADVISAAFLGEDASGIATELAGIAAFVVTLIGGIATLALIVAGVVLIVSVDESLKERAKRIVSGTLIAIIIALLSYVLLLTFAPTS